MRPTSAAALLNERSKMLSLRAVLPGGEHSYVLIGARCTVAAPEEADRRDIGRHWRWSSLCTEVHRLESTVRYLGIEVDDALAISEQTEI